MKEEAMPETWATVESSKRKVLHAADLNTLNLMTHCNSFLKWKSESHFLAVPRKQHNFPQLLWGNGGSLYQKCSRKTWLIFLFEILDLFVFLFFGGGVFVRTIPSNIEMLSKGHSSNHSWSIILATRHLSWKWQIWGLKVTQVALATVH